RPARKSFNYENHQIDTFAGSWAHRGSVGHGVFPLAATEDQTHLVFDTAIARHGDRDGIRHPGYRLEISADRLLAPGHGSNLFRHRPYRCDHSRVRITQAAAGDLDRFALRLSESVHAVCWPALDLRLDVPIGQGHGGV